jgi:oxygen-independent coproporphyrinogen-3 oxidase
MTGLPGQTKESLEKTLKTVLAFKPEHISAYGLILEEGTKLFENINNYPSIPSDEDDRDMYELGRSQITKAKLRQYEISNYAKKGYECIHNLKYWNREEYLGFGIGAASFVNETRYSNTRDINAYMDALNKKDMKLDSIRENVEKLDINDAKEEFVFLGLRKTDGISLEDYKERFGEDINKQYEKEIASNVEKGLLVIEGDRMKLTRSGVDISNSVMADFIIG